MSEKYRSKRSYKMFVDSASSDIADAVHQPGMSETNIRHLLKEDGVEVAVQHMMQAHIEESMGYYEQANKVPIAPARYITLAQARDYLKLMLDDAFSRRHILLQPRVRDALMAAIEHQTGMHVQDELVARMNAMAERYPEQFKIHTIHYDGNIDGMGKTQEETPGRP